MDDHNAATKARNKTLSFFFSYTCLIVAYTIWFSHDIDNKSIIKVMVKYFISIYNAHIS